MNDSGNKLQDSKLHRIGEVASASKLSIRTLRHYDEVGLLEPSGRSEAGYRLYAQGDLEKLQIILFYRTLEFSLDSIRDLMNSDDFDRRRALLQQRGQVSHKHRQLQQVLNLIDGLLKTEPENNRMSLNDMFEAFPDMTQELVDASEKAWGHTREHQESKRRTTGYNREDWSRLKAQTEVVNAALGARFASGVSPSHPDAVSAVETARQLINTWFFPCSRSLHALITSGNSGDPRFIAHIDSEHPGLAGWIAETAKVNASLHPD